MRIFKRLISVFTVISMIFCMFSSTTDVKAAKGDANTYISQLIAYYKNYQEDAATDIERVLQELKEVDETQYQAWSQIMDYWSYVNTEMNVNIGVAPDGLPNDDSVCIVILGFALNSDGTMKDELIGRLQVGLDTANKYPNAYVVVTGGGTAAGNPNVTEGGLMGDWLLDKGLAADRLIIEDKAPNTVGNAENTYKILNENYPSVKSLVMITSDYHVPRGCILFYSKCLLAAYESNSQPLAMISNAGYYTGSSGYESISLQASGVASVAGVNISNVNVTLSQVTGLTVTQNSAYQAGADLDLTVMASYDTNFSRDVSDLVTITNFNPSLGENQTITVSYTENGVTVSGEFDLSQTHGEIVDNAYLKALIAKVEAMNLTAYTKTSIEKLRSALAAAKAVADNNSATAAEVKAAYDALNDAVNRLMKRVNIAYKMNVETNCNENDAYKITDGTVNTGNFWASVNGSGNVASADAEVIIDLDGLYNVDCVQVYPYWGGSRIYKYELFGSTDKEHWTKIGENVSNDYATSAGFTHTMDEQIAYVKLVGIETKVVGRDDINNIHIIEIQVFGEEADNLAYGKPVTSSGTDNSAASSAGSGEAQVVDGDRSSYWDGGVYANQPWVTIDLEDVCLIDRMNVITYWARTDNRYYYYDIYTSIDGKEFTQVHSKKEGTDKSTIFGDDIDLSENPVYARYVKVVGTYDSANPSFHINEVRVYGEVVDYELILAREELQKAIDEAKNTDLSNRTEESIKALYDLIQEAEDLVNLDAATLEEIIAMKEALYAAIEALEYIGADYSEVDALIAKAEALTKEYYKDFTAVENALKAVVRGKNITEQAEVDAMARAIEAAIEALEYKDADYRAVDAAIAKAEALNKDDYVDFSAVEKAISAVARGKNITEQSSVDAMAKAIEDAIAALEKKSVQSETPSTSDNLQMMTYAGLMLLNALAVMLLKKRSVNIEIK